MSKTYDEDQRAYIEASCLEDIQREMASRLEDIQREMAPLYASAWPTPAELFGKCQELIYKLRYYD